MLKTKLNSNQLKMIAIIAMFFDHFVAVFVPGGFFLKTFLRIPGRICAPIMCYMIAEGHHYTSNKLKYILRLLIFAAISHFPYNLCMKFPLSFFSATSVMWSLAMGLIALTVIKHEKIHVIFKIGALGLCCLLALSANWNYVAVLWIVVFGIFYGDFKKQMLGFCVVGVLFHIIPTFRNFGFSHWYQACIFIAIPLLMCYSGQRGKKSKFITWFFYIFYPLHLLFLYVLRELLLLFN